MTVIAPSSAKTSRKAKFWPRHIVVAIYMSMSGITTLDYLSVGQVFTETTKIPADLFSRTYFINPLHFEQSFAFQQSFNSFVNRQKEHEPARTISDAAVLQLSKRDEKIVDRIKNLGSLDPRHTFRSKDLAY